MFTRITSGRAIKRQPSFVYVAFELLKLLGHEVGYRADYCCFLFGAILPILINRLVLQSSQKVKIKRFF